MMMMVDLELYSTRSLKQSPYRYVARLGHNILTPNQSVFARTSKCYVFNRETGNLLFIVFFAHSSHQRQLFHHGRLYVPEQLTLQSQHVTSFRSN
jgi:hypothetical protein